MPRCEAIMHSGQQCTNNSSVVTEENIHVCKKHVCYTKDKAETIYAKINDTAETLLKHSTIEDQNKIIIIGHDYDIPLKNIDGLIIDFAIVDRDDFDDLSKYNWYKTANYAAKTTDNVSILMHHYILGKPEKGFVVDHIDGNGLHNKRINLRFATFSQNSQNRDKFSLASYSKYIGVTYSEGKWLARQSNIHLGVFDNEMDAAKQYDRYVLVKLGPQSKTNGLINYDDVKYLSIEDIISKKTKDLPKHISMKN